MDSLFGTTGIRGDAGQLFTDQFCFDLGRAFAKFLATYNHDGPVAIGRDPRESSPRIASSFASGLICSGRSVYDQGIAPVPSMNYILIANPEIVGSAMISGSHIKPHLNGIKFFFDKKEILKEHEQLLQQIYFELKDKIPFKNIQLSDSGKLILSDQARDEYQKMLIYRAKASDVKLKVVVDAGNGSQSKVIPAVLKTLGMDVVEQNTDTDKNFLSRDTEVESDFVDLIQRVKAENADLGMGYDSDGDRVIFVDEQGSFIPGDYSCALIASDLATATIVTPINSSGVAETLGKKVIRTKVGSSQVVAKMIESGAGFGYESNGGGIFPEMLSRDGGRTTIEFINILVGNNIKVSEAIGRLSKFYIVKDKVEYRTELKEKIISEAKLAFKGVKTEEIDGLKIWIDESTWILFRPSANAAEFRVFAESKSKQTSDELLAQGLSFVKKITTVA